MLHSGIRYLSSNYHPINGDNITYTDERWTRINSEDAMRAMRMCVTCREIHDHAVVSGRKEVLWHDGHLIDSR